MVIAHYHLTSRVHRVAPDSAHAHPVVRTLDLLIQTDRVIKVIENLDTVFRSFAGLSSWRGVLNPELLRSAEAHIRWE
jgi:hypothetical protein